MKKDSTVYFVGFITDTGFDDFIQKWEFYAKQVSSSHHSAVLQQETEAKSRYKYVSHHKVKNDSISFSFMKGRSSEHFADQKVKVVNLGGYTVLQAGNLRSDENNESRLIAFISHNETDIDFYRQLLPARQVNIYQAYYENCVYGLIVELFPSEKDSSGLLQQLKGRTGVDATIYRECLVPHI
ncbi:MAG: hypothetical protein ABIR30_08840 [Chitinophagaceae bacterium]